jgi:hypothetical protein
MPGAAAVGQTVVDPGPKVAPGEHWHTAEGLPGGGPEAAAPVAPAAPEVSVSQAEPTARVTSGKGVLPNQHGQVWREYDISPYTFRVTSTNRPEQAIVDWVLRETGYEVWHSEPLGILSASRHTLRVYHTPEVQAVVADVVERFVGGQGESHTFGIQMVTLDSPNWRAKAQHVLRPVRVQAQGVQAWLLTREDAALVSADLRRRSDYREHNSPHLIVNHGQSTVVSATRARSYVRSVKPRPDAWPNFEPETALIDEGFSLEFSPLLSANGQSIDATIKCHIDQVEKLVPVFLDVPSPASPRQRAKIEVPQVSQFRFHERFRWPVDQVLVVEMGVVPLPIPVDGASLLPGLPLGLPTAPPRCELLVFVETKAGSPGVPRMSCGGLPDAKTYQGRY